MTGDKDFPRLQNVQTDSGARPHPFECVLGFLLPKGGAKASEHKVYMFLYIIYFFMIWCFDLLTYFKFYTLLFLF